MGTGSREMTSTDDLLEKNVEELEKAPYVEPWRRSSTPSVHVCVGGACSQNGSDTTLAEIEDLVAASGGGCKVETDWCFGRCGAGPNVLIVREGKDRFRTGVGSLEESIRTVTYAIGRSPALDAELSIKLKEVRRVHALEQDLSRAEMLVHVSACTTDDDQYDRHLASALKITDKVIAAAGVAHPLLQAHHLRRLVLGLRSKGRSASRDEDILECEWERVACWRLERVESISDWSAITPSPRATPRVSKLASAAVAAAAVAAAPPVARGQLAPMMRARGTSPYASSSMAPSWAHLARPLLEAGRSRRPRPRRRHRPRRRGCARS